VAEECRTPERPRPYAAAGVVLFGTALLAMQGWFFTELSTSEKTVVRLQSRVEVLAAEKIRNERAIDELREEYACLESGRCGDRYTATIAVRDLALLDQRIDELERRIDDHKTILRRGVSAHEGP